MTTRIHRRQFVALSCLIAVAAVGLGACSSKANTTSTGIVSTGNGTAGSGGLDGQSSVSAGSSKAAGGGAAAGATDPDAICPKLPVADAQALIHPTLSAAVADPRLGGCTFVLPGNQLNDNNLTVTFEDDAEASKRYDEDVNGTFSAGGATVSVGPGAHTPLSGVGDKAVWDSTAGYPGVSALKGNVYCSVSTADDATALTIIGAANNPLPQGTQDQQAQYAQLEGKLCVDLFSLVH